jgi:hypothetical protein
LTTNGTFITPLTKMSSLRDRVESFRQREASQQLLQTTLYDASITKRQARIYLLTKLQDLLNRIDSLETDLDQSQIAEKHYYHLMNEATQLNRDLQKAMDCNRFVVALVDGDSMPFLDSFVSRGVDGGIEAGRQLRQALTDHHQTNPLHRGDDKILIYITANLHGLSHAYKKAGVVTDTATIRDFCVGVSQSHSLTSFVDAGRQKEAADAKLRAQVELYYANAHCQQIIFGGSDSGYAPFLDTFAKAKDVNSRIVVLNPPHMPAVMHRTIAQFRSTHFPETFRASKLVTTAGRGSVKTPSPPGFKRPATELITPPNRRPPPPQYLDRSVDAKNEYDVGARSDVHVAEYRPENPSLVDDPRPPRVCYVNQYGQRLDSPLKHDPQFLRYLFQRKARLCNNHYLRGFCPYGDKCSWDHDEDLTPIQVDTLRHKARTSACRDPYCTDVDCTLGHMCPRGSGECDIVACKFSPQQHDISCTQIFEIDPVTGNRRQVQALSAVGAQLM